MILTKLEEALAAIPAQRKTLDEVELQLRSMIAKLNGMPDVTSPIAQSSSKKRYVPSPGRIPKRDKLDDIADVLRSAGEPLHITLIAEKLSSKLGKKIDRTKIEPGINRHIAKTKQPRIAKVGPSTFG